MLHTYYCLKSLLEHMCRGFAVRWSLPKRWPRKFNEQYIERDSEGFSCVMCRFTDSKNCIFSTETPFSEHWRHQCACGVFSTPQLKNKTQI